jgi:hypothetical protein
LLPKFGDLERVAGRKENAERDRTAEHHVVSSLLAATAPGMLEEFQARRTL